MLRCWGNWESFQQANCKIQIKPQKWALSDESRRESVVKVPESDEGSPAATSMRRGARESAATSPTSPGTPFTSAPTQATADAAMATETVKAATPPGPPAVGVDAGTGAAGRDNPATEVLLIVKWGGDLTELGKQQALRLGERFRQTVYPNPKGGILRLHSTFRHDLKIRTSDEGRVMKTAAAFTKGLLELEGACALFMATCVRERARIERAVR